VQWAASLDIHDIELRPTRMSTPTEGFVEFTFEIPPGKDDEPDRME
jgi:hypothetical protein